jgi:hypothetical protein
MHCLRGYFDGRRSAGKAIAGTTVTPRYSASSFGCSALPISRSHPRNMARNHRAADSRSTETNEKQYASKANWQARSYCG